MTNPTQKTYFTPKAFTSQRSSGFNATEYALAELVDNSIDAGATLVKITFVENKRDGRDYIEKIIVSDNGKGMNKEMVEDCLALGSENKDDNIKGTKRIGKFGYGLPNASLSQCTKIQVYSWEKDKPTYYHPFDLEERQDVFIPEIGEKNLPKLEQSIVGIKNPSGTVVIWEDCDRISYQRADTCIKHAEALLGRIYRYKINKSFEISFHIYSYQKGSYLQEGKAILAKPMDPLFLMDNTVISKILSQESKKDLPESEFYRKFSKSEGESIATSEKLEDHCFPTKFTFNNVDHHYEIKTSIAKLDIQKPGIKKGGDTPVGKHYRNKETIGNIYLVRDDREIECGKFTRGADQFYSYTEANRWWAIEIKWGADLDELFALKNNKQGTEFKKTSELLPYDSLFASLVEGRNAFWHQLSDQIMLASVAAKKLIRKRGEEWENQNLGPTDNPDVPTGNPGTDAPIITVEGPRTEKIPEEDLSGLIERLRDKYPNLTQEQIESTVKRSIASKSRASIFYIPSESEHLWASSKSYDWNVIEVNTNHSFYQKLIQPHRISNKNKSTLIAIELLISAAAIEEQNTIQDDARNEVIQKFRLSLALKLSEFMKEIPEIDTDEDDFVTLED